VLPGSRRSEVSRLLEPFAGAIGLLARDDGPPPQLLVPTVEGVREQVAAHAATWPIVPHILTEETDRWRAFKLARAALAASGTVTLELALAGTPMVVAYKVEPFMAPFLRRMIKAPTAVLANLVLGENAFPEHLQEACTPEALAHSVIDVMRDGSVRDRQLAALARIPDRLKLEHGTPSERAAAIVLGLARGAGRT
jgi:lipid-A-disaccharide synthase